MVRKIQTSSTTSLSIECIQYKGEQCLSLSKAGSPSLIFGYEQTKQLNTIVQSIDAGKYLLKEYGIVKK